MTPEQTQQLHAAVLIQRRLAAAQRRVDKLTTERDEKIRDLVLGVATISKSRVAAELELSRERVRQIAKQGLGTDG